MSLKLSKEEILSGNIYKGLIKITLPLIFLNLINTLYGITDTYFVGKIGELEVGAISIISPITACGTAFCEGLCAAAIALIGKAIGQNDKQKAINIATTIIKICLLLGTLTTTIIIIFNKQILNWLATPSDIYENAKYYLLGISIDLPFLFIISIYQAINTAHGDSKSGVALNTSSAILNCILDPLFIFTLKMGVFGAALATALSKIIMAPIALIKLKKENYINLNNKTDYQLIKEIITIALPSSLGYFMSSFGFLLMSKEIAKFGSLAISGYGVGSKITNLYYIFINCWGSGLTAFVATSLGAEDRKRAKESYKCAMTIVTIVALFFIPLCFSTAKPLIKLFMKNISPELLQIALEYTYYAVFTSFCMGWMCNLVGVFNGAGLTTISMLLTGSRIWFIRIPLIKLLNHLTSLGVTNVWLAMNLSNLIVASIGTLFYLFYNWQRKTR